MKLPTKEDFAAVRASIEAALKLAFERRNHEDEWLLHEGVNWGSIFVTDIFWAIDEVALDGDCEPKWLARISEASPDAWRFRTFLQEKTKPHLIEFTTEW